MRENEEIRQEATEWSPPEEDAAEDTVLPGETERDKLLRELEQSKKEAAEANDKYLRTYADFENYRKRMQRDLADFRTYANEQLALELLSVVDHMELALNHASEAGENEKGIVEGVQLVLKQFLDVLAKFGVTQFVPDGEPFDPARHDAVMQTATDAVPENTVMQVVQKGYRYHDKVLRHAKVGVATKAAGRHPAGVDGSEHE